MKKIRFVSLEDVCVDIVDCPHSTPKWLNEGIPVIRNYNLVDGYIDTSNLSYVDKDTYLDRIKRAKPEQDDIIISREAPMGMAGIIPPDFKCCLGQRVVLLKPDKTKVDSYYLLYALLSDIVQTQIEQINKTGSIVSNLNIKDLKQLQIPITDLKNQKSIANLLKNIDSKLNVNQIASKELESMTRIIYDYWFLQFEFPDRDGKPYKSNGGKMVWNDQLKQKIPDGWKVEKCKKYIKVIRGVSYKPRDKQEEKEKDILPLLKSNNVEDGKINFNSPVYLKKDLVSPEKMLKGNSVFITMSSGSKSALGKTAIIYNDLPYAFGAFCARIEFSPTMQGYLSIIFRSSYFNNYINQITSGTSINNIKKSQLEDLTIIIPTDSILQKFESLVKDIFKKQANLQKENQQLKSLRDFLLPLLMNGQVTIGD